MAGASAALGLYLRTLDVRRASMVVEARRAQRLELARDLHDFVAHDVTGMVVHAQVAQVIAQRDPDEALAALARIEASAQQALRSLDRTVRIFGDLSGRAGAPSASATADDGASSVRTLGLGDVFELVGRYTANDRAPVHLHVDASLDQHIPREVSSTAYRIVLEALTNVRRHAPAAARVTVTIAPLVGAHEPALTVRVTNETRPGRSAERPSVTAHQRPGTGLAGACGFLLKRSGPALLVEAVRAAMDGDAHISPSVTVRPVRHLRDEHKPESPLPRSAEELTEREIDVARLVADGQTNAEIGAELFISAGTRQDPRREYSAKARGAQSRGHRRLGVEHGGARS